VADRQQCIRNDARVASFGVQSRWERELPVQDDSRCRVVGLACATPLGDATAGWGCARSQGDTAAGRGGVRSQGVQTCLHPHPPLPGLCIPRNSDTA